MKYLNTIISDARQRLNDLPATTEDFTDEVLTSIAGDVLVEISDMCPAESKETMTTTVSSYDLDVSDIENLIKVLKVEIPVGNSPPSFRNCSRFGNIVTFEYGSTPSGETIYLYCTKVHTLTESDSTLNGVLEKICTDGIAAYAALWWVNNIRPRIEQAIADLASGRSLINQVSYAGNPQGDYAKYASSEGSLASLVNQYQTWGNNKLGLYRADLRRIKKNYTRKSYPAG